MLTIGVVSTSRKENERRVAIHPDQLGWIVPQLRKHLLFEEDYGLPFSVPNAMLASMSQGLAPRDALFQQADIILLPKPMLKDFEQMRPETTLWGWTHLVQDPRSTQIAIEKRLSVIAFENMNTWDESGAWIMHVFQKNNEIAGYAGVVDALTLSGITGLFGPRRKAVVIGDGAAARGAVYGLQSLSIHNITVLTGRPASLVPFQVPRIKYLQMRQDSLEDNIVILREDGSRQPIMDLLGDADVIVNAILQDPNQPWMYVREGEEDRLRSGSLIIDISCDEGMGFFFAQPTTISAPMARIEHFNYYAVDHTSSLFWNSATWENSRSLLPFLEPAMKGQDDWDRNPVIRHAVEVKNGLVLNPKILAFQNRRGKYPHPIIE